MNPDDIVSAVTDGSGIDLSNSGPWTVAVLVGLIIYVVVKGLFSLRSAKAVEIKPHEVEEPRRLAPDDRALLERIADEIEVARRDLAILVDRSRRTR